ncbi:hypothetical protein H696_05755 [Fonticula alba]|uniref:Uncharacterized protein n=1 Tax=Fonticula alba TaxID=691883 RepID=A0A058Z0M4_FONAL|nr:hypothetical protein H696_05755 [Fonticula alba]KCV67810.1 hypothetical protein H696_05755 [Fonticula alba]|eukprot:XP_009497841.1 hypothetical protein H696_05755 [Fonticula alba]
MLDRSDVAAASLVAACLGIFLSSGRIFAIAERHLLYDPAELNLNTLDTTSLLLDRRYFHSTAERQLLESSSAFHAFANEVSLNDLASIALSANTLLAHPAADLLIQRVSSDEVIEHILLMAESEDPTKRHAGLIALASVFLQDYRTSRYLAHGAVDTACYAFLRYDDPTSLRLALYPLVRLAASSFALRGYFLRTAVVDKACAIIDRSGSSFSPICLRCLDFVLLLSIEDSLRAYRTPILRTFIRLLERAPRFQKLVSVIGAMDTILTNASLDPVDSKPYIKPLLSRIIRIIGNLKPLLFRPNSPFNKDAYNSVISCLNLAVKIGYDPGDEVHDLFDLTILLPPYDYFSEETFLLFLEAVERLAPLAAEPVYRNYFEKTLNHIHILFTSLVSSITPFTRRMLSLFTTVLPLIRTHLEVENTLSAGIFLRHAQVTRETAFGPIFGYRFASFNSLLWTIAHNLISECNFDQVDPLPFLHMLATLHISTPFNPAESPEVDPFYRLFATKLVFRHIRRAADIARLIALPNALHHLSPQLNPAHPYYAFVLSAIFGSDSERLVWHSTGIALRVGAAVDMTPSTLEHIDVGCVEDDGDPLPPADWPGIVDPSRRLALPRPARPFLLEYPPVLEGLAAQADNRTLANLFFAFETFAFGSDAHFVNCAAHITATSLALHFARALAALPPPPPPSPAAGGPRGQPAPGHLPALDPLIAFRATILCKWLHHRFTSIDICPLTPEEDCCPMDEPAIFTLAAHFTHWAGILRDIFGFAELVPDSCKAPFADFFLLFCHLTGTMDALLQHCSRSGPLPPGLVTALGSDLAPALLGIWSWVLAVSEAPIPTASLYRQTLAHILGLLKSLHMNGLIDPSTREQLRTPNVLLGGRLSVAPEITQPAGRFAGSEVLLLPLAAGGPVHLPRRLLRRFVRDLGRVLAEPPGPGAWFAEARPLPAPPAPPASLLRGTWPRAPCSAAGVGGLAGRPKPPAPPAPPAPAPGDALFPAALPARLGPAGPLVRCRAPLAGYLLQGGLHTCRADTFPLTPAPGQPVIFLGQAGFHSGYTAPAVRLPHPRPMDHPTARGILAYGGPRGAPRQPPPRSADLQFSVRLRLRRGSELTIGWLLASEQAPQVDPALLQLLHPTSIPLDWTLMAAAKPPSVAALRVSVTGPADPGLPAPAPPHPAADASDSDSDSDSDSEGDLGETGETDAVRWGEGPFEALFEALVGDPGTDDSQSSDEEFEQRMYERVAREQGWHVRGPSADSPAEPGHPAEAASPDLPGPGPSDIWPVGMTAAQAAATRGSPARSLSFERPAGPHQDAPPPAAATQPSAGRRPADKTAADPAAGFILVGRTFIADPHLADRPQEAYSDAGELVGRVGGSSGLRMFPIQHQAHMEVEVRARVDLRTRSLSFTVNDHHIGVVYRLHDAVDEVFFVPMIVAHNVEDVRAFAG